MYFLVKMHHLKCMSIYLLTNQFKFLSKMNKLLLKLILIIQLWNIEAIINSVRKGGVISHFIYLNGKTFSFVENLLEVVFLFHSKKALTIRHTYRNLYQSIVKRKLYLNVAHVKKILNYGYKYSNSLITG